MASNGGGGLGQFTYDFGVKIAQGTVGQLTKLAGVSLTLAGAFHALQVTAEQYIGTLKSNVLKFGGVTSTLKTMESLQNRLIEGQTKFSVSDQMKAMEMLSRAGLDVRQNLAFIEKAADATGQSVGEFANTVHSAIMGNMQGLVDMGILTQRAAKYYDMYGANTYARQRAIMQLLRNNKALSNAIENSFLTVEASIRRIKEVFTSFFQSVVGKPQDRDSLYGSVARAMKGIADVLSKAAGALKNFGKGIGIVLGWIIRNVGRAIQHLMYFMGKVIGITEKSSENFVLKMRSFVVWLEFWKQAVVGTLREIYHRFEPLFIWGARLLLVAVSLRKIISVLSTLKKVATFLGMRSALLTSVDWLLTTALPGIVAVLTSVYTWILLIAIVLYNKTEWFRQRIDQIYGWIKSIGKIMWDVFVGATGYWLQIFKKTYNFISGTFIPKVKNMFMSFKNWLKDIWNSQIFKDIRDFLSMLFVAHRIGAKAVHNLLSTGLGWVGEKASSFAEAGKEAGGLNVKTYSGNDVFQTATGSSLGGDLSDAWGFIKNGFSRPTVGGNVTTNNSTNNVTVNVNGNIESEFDFKKSVEAVLVELINDSNARGNGGNKYSKSN